MAKPENPVQKALKKLDAGPEIHGFDRIFTLGTQELLLTQALKYQEKLRAHRPQTPEAAAGWDQLLVEQEKEVKRLRAEGKRLGQLSFKSEEEKRQAISKALLLLKRVEEAPVIEKKKK